MGIIDRLKYARERANLSQKELAKLLDMTPSNWSKIETGKLGISLERVQQVSKVLNVAITYLIGSEDIEVKSIETLKLEPGDSLVVHTKRELSREEWDRIVNYIHIAFPDHTCLLLPEEFEIKVVKGLGSEPRLGTIEHLREAIVRVRADLAKLTDEEFAAELEQHKDGEIARMLTEIWEGRGAI